MSAKEASIQDAVDWILSSCGNGFTDADNKNLKSKNGAAKEKDNRCYGGPLSQLALQKLSLLCASLNSLEGWKDVDAESLLNLLEYLRDHVDSAASVDMFREAKEAAAHGESQTVSEKRSASFQIAVVHAGLEAASILVSIITAPNLDPKLVNDETISSFVALLRQHTSRHILPALSSIELILSNIIPLKDSDKVETSNSTRSTEKVTSARKRPISKISTDTSGSKHTPHSSRSLVCDIGKNIISSLDLFTNLLDNIDHLCRKMQVDDQHILVIVQCCLSLFTLDPFCSSCISSNQALICIRSLYNSATALITTLFQLHTRHRDGIIQDLFPLILKLPTSKKSLRLFQVTSYYGRSTSGWSGTVSVGSTPLYNCSQLDVHIQAISVLILRLIQSCVLMPSASDLEETIDDGKNNPGQSPTAQVPKQDIAQNRKKNGAPKAEALNNKAISATSLDDQNDKLEPLHVIQGLGHCRKLVALLVTELIVRCNRKSDEASDFRVFLSNFIEDLLLLVPSLEFPAAETVLHALCRQLLEIVVQSSSIGSLNKVPNRGGSIVEGGLQTSVLDILGSICADLAYKQLWLRKRPIKLPKSLTDIPLGTCPKESELRDEDSVKDFSLTTENCQCFCGRNFVDTFMLDCDRCHKWFHGSCAGIPRDKPLKIWFCDECVLHERLLEQAKSFFTLSKKMTDIEFSCRDHIQIMRTLLLNDLTASKASNRLWCNSDPILSDDITKMVGIATTFQHARWYLLATWIEDNESKRKITSERTHDSIDSSVISSRFLSEWYAHLADQGMTQGRIRTDCETRASLLLCLFCWSSPLASFSSQILGFLIAIMGDQSANLRKGGVKALTQVVHVDSNLMNQREVREAVAKMFSDDSISVREAAIALVGTYITRVPQLCNIFHSVLLDRLQHDVGVSVRKRVVKILKDVISSEYSYQGRPATCVAMIERMIDPKEDDSVRDLIHQTFQSLWFDPQISCQCQRNDLVDTRSENSFGDKTKCVDRVDNVASIARQMVNVMKFSERPNHLVSLVKEFSKAASTTTAVKANGIEKHLSSIASSLIDMLLSFEGNQSIEQRVNSKAAISSGEELVAIIRTVSVFADGAPSTLIKYIDTLLPFLKGDNGVGEDRESLIVMLVCRILSSLVQAASTFETASLFDESLIEDLTQIVYRFGSVTMGASIELMVQLSERCRASGVENTHEKKLFMLASTFYSYLLRIKDTTENISQTTPKVLSNIHRSLAGLGYICRYNKSLNLSSASELLIEIVQTSQLHWTNVWTASYAVFEHFTQQTTDITTRCHALRAITAVCIAEPRILLYAEQRGLFNRIISNECNTELLTDALRCWEDMLVSEENRLENGNAKREMDQRKLSLSDKISGDQDSDASLIGSCCAQHANALLECSVHMNRGVRYQSLSLIDVLLRQGLMNPMEAVPYLFSLQGDSDTTIRQYSLKLLLREGDRRPDMLRQRLFSGLIGAFYLQRKLGHESQPTALQEMPNKRQKICICTDIYKRFILSSRSQSNKLLSSLLESFKYSSQLSVPLRSLVSDFVLHESSERILILCFLSEIIAHFPYDHLCDVLYVVNFALSQVTLDGFGLAHAYEEILHPAAAHTDFKDAKEKSKIEKKIYTLLVKNAVNIDDFSDLCRSAVSVILLLRVKSFLCNTYSVTESRLREFQDGGKKSVGDKVISQPDDIGVFCSDVPKLYKEDGVTFNADNLVRIYCEFKDLFRNHSA